MPGIARIDTPNFSALMADRRLVDQPANPGRLGSKPPQCGCFLEKNSLDRNGNIRQRLPDGGSLQLQSLRHLHWAVSYSCLRNVDGRCAVMECGASEEDGKSLML
jgi:hypothetical protein